MARIKKPPNYKRMTPEALSAIRYLRQQGNSIRDIAKSVSYTPKTVQKWLNKPSTDDEWKHKRASRLDPYKGEIEHIIMDSQKYKKQSLNYQGAHAELLKRYPNLDISYAAFCVFVRTRCTIVKEDTLAAIPLAHDPGVAQIDFFDAMYFKNGKTVHGHGFSMSFPYSDSKFLQIYPAENQECLFHAMIKVFSAIGFVPRAILFDNATTAVVKVDKKGRVVNKRYSEFAAHFGFEPRFCNPARGREKGSVERNNQVMRKKYLSPPPHIDTEESFNTGMLQTCLDALATTTHYRKHKLKSLLFADDKKAGLPIPKAPFDERRTLTRKADNCAMILVNNCWYSTSDKHAQRNLIIKLGAFTVEIYDEYGDHIWTHDRSYCDGETIIAKAAYADALLARPNAKIANGDTTKGGTPNKLTEIKKTLKQTRPKMRGEVLEEIMETQNVTLEQLANEHQGSLFDIQPYRVSKEEYDIAIKRHG